MNRWNEAWNPYVLNILKRYPKNKHAEEDEAIRKALEVADAQTVAIVDMVYFGKTKSISGAAEMLFISYSTAWRNQMTFRREVAKNLNLPM